MRLSISLLFVLLPAVASLSACRTTNAEDGSELHNTPPSSAPADVTLDSLKSMSQTQWKALFANGKANQELIPSRDHPGVLTKGAGFPLIFQTIPFGNTLANRLWNGKNFITRDAVTTLKNQFVEESGTSVIRLFDAVVVVEPETREGDGKPVILLDYRISGVPGIEAIRDEIRLVRESTTEEGGHVIRHRLYLGPTYLLPEQLLTPASVLARPWEFHPILWFALEFHEPMS